jgi:hypothetical protein
MSIEWKTGDIAQVTHNDGQSRIGMRFGGVSGAWEHGDERQFKWRDDEVSEARPLVVIDPEDREQIQRLMAGYFDHNRGIPADAPIRSTGVDYMQSALREFANPTPPKPPEPTNYLAVVQTSDGRRYWRWSSGTMHTSVPWRVLGAVHADTEDEDGNFRYDELHVVEIESEGVSA